MTLDNLIHESWKSMESIIFEARPREGRLPIVVAKLHVEDNFALFTIKESGGMFVMSASYGNPLRDWYQITPSTWENLENSNRRILRNDMTEAAKTFREEIGGSKPIVFLNPTFGLPDEPQIITI